MSRKYLQGTFTPSEGVGLDVTELTDARFIFNEDYSSFTSEPFIASLDLYSGDTLLMSRYTMATLDDGTYDDIETSYLTVVKEANALTGMSITS